MTTYVVLRVDDDDQADDLRDVTKPAKRCQAEARDPKLCGCYCGKFRDDALAREWKP